VNIEGMLNETRLAKRDIKNENAELKLEIENSETIFAKKT
jgi:hypothetical protein